MKKKIFVLFIFFSLFFTETKSFHHPQIAFKLMKNSFFVQQIKPTVALISLNLWRMKRGFHSLSLALSFSLSPCLYHSFSPHAVHFFFNVLVFHQFLFSYLVCFLLWCGCHFTAVARNTEKSSAQKGEWDRMDYDFEIDCFVAWHFSFIYCVRVHGKRTLSNWLWSVYRRATTTATPPTGAYNLTDWGF